MYCFRPEKRPSIPDQKQRKGLISSLQNKVLKRIETSKPAHKTNTQYQLSRHLSSPIPRSHHQQEYRYYHCHFKQNCHCHCTCHHGHQSQQTDQKRGIINTKYNNSERFYVEPINSTSDIKRKHATTMEITDYEQEVVGDDDDDTSAAPMAQERHGVDAIAEEFISKMKRGWELERQKSEEDNNQRWVSLYDH